MGKTLKNQRFYRFFCRKFVDISKNMLIIVIRMGMQKDKQKAEAAALSALSQGKTAVGARQIRKALTAGSARRVFLAENADPALTEPIVALCQRNSVEYVWVRSMTDLGRACGIEVGAAAAAVVA